MTPAALLRTAIELLLLTVFVYRVLLIFRTGRATGILFTLVLLAVVYVLADQLNMRTIVYLFQELTPILGIILVIVFQPEIRRALERSGNLGAVLTAGMRGRTEEALQVIDTLVKVCEDFSSRRVGALIVLEQRTSLDSYIETGELLDARLSPDLLESIFHHTSPMHDGAVILRGNRVMAARCFLPLTDRTDLPAHFGTRHRAAVGLSEMADAVILVVSEESGRMSLVTMGRVAEGLAPVALRYQLQSLLAPNASISSRLDTPPEAQAARRGREILEEAE
ncbi:MAG TPA: diadenylate cyclase CdaA [bacterium]|nr:diadenylate cyclase CdaA [bacterium]